MEARPISPRALPRPSTMATSNPELEPLRETRLEFRVVVDEAPD
jgi:hypothetical protein